VLRVLSCSRHRRNRQSIRGCTRRPGPYLVDRVLRIALEADSFEWRGDPAALKRDARRYNLLVVDGWIVLRFAWEDVMFDPEYVRAVLCSVVALVTGPAEACCVHHCAA
jgi:very-short-patch-repair endonuclease